MTYANNTIYPYVFITRSNSRFAIVAMYIDDLNIIETSGELNETIAYLMKEVEMKYLGEIKFCFNMHIEH